MKKKYYVRTFPATGKLKKLFLIMRLSVILLFVSVLTAVGNSYSQNTRFSFN